MPDSDYWCSKCKVIGHVRADHYVFVTDASHMADQQWRYFAFRIPNRLYDFLHKSVLP